MPSLAGWSLETLPVHSTQRFIENLIFEKIRGGLPAFQAFFLSPGDHIYDGNINIDIDVARVIASRRFQF